MANQTSDHGYYLLGAAADDPRITDADIRVVARMLADTYGPAASEATAAQKLKARNFLDVMVKTRGRRSAASNEPAYESPGGGGESGPGPTGELARFRADDEQRRRGVWRDQTPGALPLVRTTAAAILAADKKARGK